MTLKSKLQKHQQKKMFLSSFILKKISALFNLIYRGFIRVKGVHSER